MGKSVDDMIKGLEQENDALKKRVKKLESNLSRAKYALDEEIYRGMEYKEKVKELEERIKQERDFAEMLADKSRLIAIDRADKAEASLTISEKSRKVLRDSYFKLEDQADKWESELSILKEQRESCIDEIVLARNKFNTLKEAVKDALTNGDEINTIDYRSTWKTKLKKALEDQADKWESELAMLREAVENHEKARKMGVRGSGVDSELYSASDKIEKELKK